MVEHPGDSHSNGAGLSRRSFIEVAVGAISAIPIVAGTSLVAPARVAFADEVSEVDGGDATQAGQLKIIAAKPYEASFMVCDMADAGATHIIGAKVRLTSLSTKQTVEGTTDADGVVQLDIADLCADQPGVTDKHKLARFEFEASAYISCEGYRDCEIQRMQMEGGMLYEIPTRKLTEGLPYPVCASLNGWDMLYTKNEFLSLASNTEKQVAVCTIKNLGSGSATISLLPGKDAAPIATTRVNAVDGVATATFTQELLQKGKNTALSDSQTNYLRVEKDGKAYLTPLSLKLSQGVGGDKPDGKENVSLSPLSADGNAISGLGLKWPSYIPVIGGSDIKVWTPDWIVNVDYNPFGYLRVTVPVKRWGVEVNSEKGQTNKGFSMPRKTIGEQFNKLMDTAKAMSDKTGDAFANGGAISKIDSFGVASCKVNLQLVLGAQWQSEKHVYQFSGGMQIHATMAASYTVNFFLGPVPALVTVGFDANANASGTLGAFVRNPQNGGIFEALTDFDHMEWDPANTGLSVRISPVVSLSVGVGIRGVASICIKGSVGLAFYIGWSPAAPSKGLPAAHIMFGYIAKVDLVLHMFLFTKTFNLADGSNSKWIDNWKGMKIQGEAAEEDYLWEDYSLEDIAYELNPITDDMLGEVVEGEFGDIDYGFPEDLDIDKWVEEYELGRGGYDDNFTEDAGWYEWSWADLEVEAESVSDEAPTTERVFGRVEFTEEGSVVEHLDDGGEVEYFSYSFGITPVEEPSQQPKETNATPKADKDEGIESVGAQAEQATSAPVTEEGIDSVQENPDTLLAPGVGVAVPDATTVGAEAVGTADGAGETPVSSTVIGAQEAASSVPEGTDTDTVVTDMAPMADAASSSDEAPAIEEANVPAEEEGIVAAEESSVNKGILAAQGFVNAEAVAVAEAAPGISGLGVSGGLRPSVDKMIYQNVFGDPRAKVVTFTFSGVQYTFLFRLGIANVKVLDIKKRRFGLEPRTRVMATVLEGDVRAGDSYVFDINVNPQKLRNNFTRWDYYDYDFDVQYLPETKEFALTVVCGKRKIGDDDSSTIKLDGAMSETAFLFYTIGAFNLGSGMRNATRWFVRYADEVLGDRGMGTHSISNLQCHYNEDYTMLATFLDRTGDSSEDIVSDSRATARMGIMFVNFSRSKNEKDAVKVLNWDKLGISLPHDIFEVNVSTRVAGQHTVMLRGGGTVSFLLMSVDNNGLTGIKKCNTTYKYDANDPQGSILPRLVAWPGHDTFLCAHEGKLQTAAWNNGDLTFTPVGPSNYGVSAFGVSRKGNFIFWPQSRDGDVVKHDDDGNTELVKEDVYQIVACRVRDGKFSDPFIIADLSHDTDQISVVEVSGSALDLLITEITTTENAANNMSYGSNLWRTKIPHTQCVTAMGAETPNLRVAPGGEAPFDVTLRNDGNTYLKGCTIVMFENGTEVTGASKEITFGEDTLRPSMWNEPDDNGVPQGAESDYALAPGKSQVHRAFIPIPADWSGAKKVSFVARSPQLVSGNDIYAEAADEWDEGEIIEYSANEPIMAEMDFVDIYEDESDWADYSDAPVQVANMGSSNSGAANGSGSASSVQRAATPRTADSGGSGLLAAGIGAAGAAVLVYERRRAKSEK